MCVHATPFCGLQGGETQSINLIRVDNEAALCGKLTYFAPDLIEKPKAWP
jgi:hypothetical protein